MLGWDYQPGNADQRSGPTWSMAIDAGGARRNPLFADAEPAVAAYGDSFTAGVDVDDEETWAYFLSQRLGRLVANYGVGGYGTDQALLKFKIKHADRPTPPSVALGIYEENVNRIFNRYRPYYLPGTGVLFGFKPRFALEDGALRLIANPMLRPPQSEAEFLALASSARDGDLWYASRVDCAARKPPYAAFIERLRADYAAHPALIVDVAEATFDAARFNVQPFEGHASAYGNQMIADHLAAAMRRAGAVIP